jgi:hypothetical protein
VERWVLPFLHNGHLRPVVIAILGHVGLAIALPLLAFARSGRSDDGAVLLGVAALTWLPAFAEWRIERRAGAMTVVVLGAWFFGLIIAAWGWSSGVL